jgi:hypothetical protein
MQLTTSIQLVIPNHAAHCSVGQYVTGGIAIHKCMRIEYCKSGKAKVLLSDKIPTMSNNVHKLYGIHRNHQVSLMLIYLKALNYLSKQNMKFLKTCLRFFRITNAKTVENQAEKH